MDPNSSKKGMFNKLNKLQALEKLSKEIFSRTTASFYKYIIIEEPVKLRDKLYKNWQELGVLGRIYIAKEGINAQLSVPEHNFLKFKNDLRKIKYFEDIKFKIALDKNRASFFKLQIKVKNKIVADGLDINEYDVTNVGNHLSAIELNKAIDEGATVVDMRNHYESEIGHFKGAICPDVETFKEELPFVKRMLKGKEKKKILLYCTGGIRCEKASSYLKHYGFHDVNQLHGGIIDYVHQTQKNKSLENKFLGKNFVFDERLAEVASDNIVSSCHQCDNKSDTHTNCKNVNCNLLFIQCKTCKEKNNGCCSPNCISVLNQSEKKQNSGVLTYQNKKRFHRHKKINLRKLF